MARTLYTGLTCPDAGYVHTPLIEIRPLEDDAPLRRALARLADYDYLLLTSRQAVAPLVASSPLAPAAALAGSSSPSVGCAAALPQPSRAPAAALAGSSSSSVGCAAALPQHPRVVAIGPATAAALRAAGFARIEQPEEDNSPAVVRWFARQPRGRVLIPRSSLALSIIPEGLRRLGFEVDCVTAYVTCMPAHPRKVDLTAIDRIVFTSPSTIDNFVRLYGSLPLDKQLATRGPVTEQHLQTVILQQKKQQL